MPYKTLSRTCPHTPHKSSPDQLRALFCKMASNVQKASLSPIREVAVCDVWPLHVTVQGISLESGEAMLVDATVVSTTAARSFMPCAYMRGIG